MVSCDILKEKLEQLVKKSKTQKKVESRCNEIKVTPTEKPTCSNVEEPKPTKEGAFAGQNQRTNSDANSKTDKMVEIGEIGATVQRAKAQNCPLIQNILEEISAPPQFANTEESADTKIDLSQTSEMWQGDLKYARSRQMYLQCLESRVAEIKPTEYPLEKVEKPAEYRLEKTQKSVDYRLEKPTDYQLEKMEKTIDYQLEKAEKPIDNRLEKSDSNRLSEVRIKTDKELEKPDMLNGNDVWLVNTKVVIQSEMDRNDPKRISRRYIPRRKFNIPADQDQDTYGKVDLLPPTQFQDAPPPPEAFRDPPEPIDNLLYYVVESVQENREMNKRLQEEEARLSKKGAYDYIQK